MWPILQLLTKFYIESPCSETGNVENKIRTLFKIIFKNIFKSGCKK